MPKTLSEHQSAIASLDSVAPGVIGLRTIMVNVYAVSGDNGSWVLIDAGLPFTAGRILSWAKRHFGDQRPSAILLTHGHFDHVGGLKTLARKWDVPVYAHPLEIPYITGQSKYPPPDPSVGRGSMSMMSVLYPRGPINLSDKVEPLPEDGSAPHLPDWRWIHTPGHAPGHVSFFRDSDRALIAGDAITTTKQESLRAVVSQRPELHGPPAYYTCDWDAARDSVQWLAALSPSVLAAGHGIPMSGHNAEEGFQRLAATFDRQERPKKGRYAHRPAVADESGVREVPPAVVSSSWKLAGGVALAGAGILIAAKMSRPKKRRGRTSTLAGLLGTIAMISRASKLVRK
jgi:glyoxylase-like metal-dependent hydrolase (beta-lactamase superfamily II)